MSGLKNWQNAIVGACNKSRLRVSIGLVSSIEEEAIGICCFPSCTGSADLPTKLCCKFRESEISFIPWGW